ncbi:MAG: hypothetical protein K8S62_10120 [Candidatus Sabulitectum sp.]|nr:hypothetical protein [Candidatus Sabulitectum sp.]
MIVSVIAMFVPFLTGLNGPDGLYATENGIYVCEENTGRILCVTADGNAIVVAEGLASPEGIYVAEDGRILVVEDTMSGRLVEIHHGCFTTLASDLCCPEGVTVDNRGTIWFTTGGIEGGSIFTTLWKITSNIPTREYSLPSAFSFSDLEVAADGMIYICSESSGIFGNVAVFRFDPVTFALTPFVTGVTACEGIGMTDGGFPFYITEESGAVYRVDSSGVLSLVQSNLSAVEDVAVFNNQIFVTEDGTGSLLRLDVDE